jgi:hypothetical protein
MVRVGVMPWIGICLGIICRIDVGEFLHLYMLWGRSSPMANCDRRHEGNISFNSTLCISNLIQ